MFGRYYLNDSKRIYMNFLPKAYPRSERALHFGNDPDYNQDLGSGLLGGGLHFYQKCDMLS